MTSLSVFILCHNRPDDAQKAIASVLAQTDRDFELIVSDNSSTDDVQTMLKRNFPTVHCVRRAPMLPALEHFNRCIEEVQTTHFCLFHDDDLMHPDYVAQVKRVAQAHPEAVAIGCNATIETMGITEATPSFRALNPIQMLRHPAELAQRYFARYQSGIAPFPGYTYHRERIGGVRFDPQGGKYSDVSWLLNLAQLGPLVWLNQPLMTYRIHTSNDGNTESRRDRLRFLGYLKKHQSTWAKSILEDYRCSFIYKPVRNHKDELHLQRRLMATRFLKHYSWARYLRLDTWNSLMRHALVKWMGTP